MLGSGKKGRYSPEGHAASTGSGKPVFLSKLRLLVPGHTLV